MAGSPRKSCRSHGLQLFFFDFPIYDQTVGLQRYASDWDSVQAYASNNVNLWVK